MNTDLNLYKKNGFLIKENLIPKKTLDKINKIVKEVVSKADGFGPGLYVVGDRAILFDGTNYSYDY